MPQLYKSSKSLKGVGASWSLNSKDGSLFLQLIKQTGYSEEKHLGTFSGGEKINVKFNIWEIGSLLNCFKDNKEYSFFHKAAKGNTSIRFAPYFVKQEDGKGEQRGYGITVNKLGADNKSELSWLLPISFGEKEALSEYLSYALRRIYDAEYAEAKKAYKSKKDQKSETQPEPLPVTVSTEEAENI